MEYNDFSNLVTGINSLELAAKDKGLAKLGDELINFCFSLAKSIFMKKCTGEKVSAKILTKAMKASNLRNYAKLRAKSHDIADAAESIIAYSFLKGNVTIEEMTDRLLAGYTKYNGNGILSEGLDCQALTVLLIHLRKKAEIYPKEEN